MTITGTIDLALCVFELKKLHIQKGAFRTASSLVWLYDMSLLTNYIIIILTFFFSPFVKNHTISEYSFVCHHLDEKHYSCQIMDGKTHFNIVLMFGACHNPSPGKYYEVQIMGNNGVVFLS